MKKQEITKEIIKKILEVKADIEYQIVNTEGNDPEDYNLNEWINMIWDYIKLNSKEDKNGYRK